MTESDDDPEDILDFSEFEKIEGISEYIEKASSVGLGLGATPYAKFLVALGLLTFEKMFLESVKTRKRKGAPKKALHQDIDCFRAFKVWEAKRMMGWVCSNRGYVKLLQELEKLDAHSGDRVFPADLSIATLEQSLSRGKKKMAISDDWNTSKVCERILRN